MDNATRAAIEAHSKAPHDMKMCWACVVGTETLLAAYDSIVGDATDLADRLAACQVERDALQAHLEEGMRMMLALRAELAREHQAATQNIQLYVDQVLALRAAQVQATPVLAAADAWADDLPIETGEAGLRLMSAVLARRAAREG